MVGVATISCIELLSVAAMQHMLGLELGSRSLSLPTSIGTPRLHLKCAKSFCLCFSVFFLCLCAGFYRTASPSAVPSFSTVVCGGALEKKNSTRICCQWLMNKLLIALSLVAAPVGWLRSAISPKVTEEDRENLAKLLQGS